jgi:hypothetical protein
VVFSDSVIRDTFLLIGNLSPNKTYKFKVRGLSFGNACSSYTPDQVIKTSAIKTLFVVVPPSCPGEVDAQVSITPNNGTAPYSILWNNGNTTTALSNVASGTYTVTVTDATGEVAVATVNVLEPAPLAGTINKVGNNLTAFGSGGTPPYTYAWSNGVNGAGNNGVSSGTFSVTISDSKGCSTTQTYSFATGVNDDKELNAEVKAFPNPVAQGQNLNLALSVSSYTTATVNVFHTNGQLLQQSSVALATGDNVLNIPTANLAAGIYYVEFKAGGSRKTIRVTVF